MPSALSADALAQESDARYLDFVMACDQGALVCVGSMVIIANDTAVGLLGALSADEIIGRPIADFFAPPNDRRVGGELAYMDVPALRRDGTTVQLKVAQLACRYRGDDAIQILLRSASQSRLLESRVQFLLQHDILTELPNRTGFRDHLVGAIARAQRNARRCAVMLFNVDHFSVINKQHGVEAGDIVLREVARRLKSSIRLADSAARIGSDGFGLILEALDQREQAAVVANRAIVALKAPIDIGSISIEVSCSAGVAGYPDDAPDIDSLLRMADVALLAAKDSGRGTFRFYFPEFEAMTHRDELRRSEIDKRIESLTAREREVMDVLMDGNSNKAIAYLLGASPRTIENHRAKVMAKLSAESLPDLVRMVMASSHARKK